MSSTGWLRLISGVVRRIPIKQAAVTLIVALLLTSVLVWTRGHGLIWAPGGKCQQVVIASSQEKSRMLAKLAKSYNNSGPTVGSRLNPVCVNVDVNEVYSGDAEAALENNWKGQKKEERPDVWAPASSAWVQLLRARARGPTGLIPDDYYQYPLFSSPLVIAMPDQMARAMGYPAPITWTAIFELVNNPAGWGSKGHPEWGPFRLGQTNPHISTSGLHALIAMYAANHADIDVAAVNKPEAPAFAARIQQRVAHFRQTASAFLEALREVDRNSSDDHLKVFRYVSAVPIEEKQLVDYNNGKPSVRLLPIYPEDSPTADHPYVILNWRETTELQRDAAAKFYHFLKAAAQQDIADQNFFRRTNGEAGNNLLQQREVNRLPPSPLPPRDGAVLAAEPKAWDGQRKPVRVMFLVNRAADAKALDDAISLLQGALEDYQPQDQVMVAAYPANPGSADPFLVIQPMTHTDSSHLGELRRALDVPKLAVKSNLPRPLNVPLEGALTWMDSSFVPTAINAILLICHPDPNNPATPNSAIDAVTSHRRASCESSRSALRTASGWRNWPDHAKALTMSPVK